MAGHGGLIKLKLQPNLQTIIVGNVKSLPQKVSSADSAPEGVPTVQHPMDVSLATVHIMTVRQLYIMCAFFPPLVGGSEVRIHEEQAGRKE